jgi:CheY-like chemotaxis protein
MADPAELELAIMNLVLNARDALPGGGVITISAENTSGPSRDLDRKLHGELVAISVNDTGVGIPADVLAKVFDPFFTTKHATKGTGLGLSQVYGFAHQSGGTVTVESEVSKGTRVTMYLPRAVLQSSAGPPTADEDHTGAPLTGVSILVVEDNPDVTEVTAALIKQLGYKVSVASDAATALASMEAEKFSLVFSDIMLPGDMDGVALARTIGERYPDIPVLLASGSNKRVEAAQGEFPTLQKPYSISELDRALWKLLIGARDLGEDNLVHLPSAKRKRGFKADTGRS